MKTISIQQKYKEQAKMLVALEMEVKDLRAKAEAWDKGEHLWMSFDADTNEPYAVDRDVAVVTHDTWKLLGRHPQGNMPGGFIKKRVRVCEVTAAGEKPALATNEKGE